MDSGWGKYGRANTVCRRAGLAANFSRRRELGPNPLFSAVGVDAHSATGCYTQTIADIKALRARGHRETIADIKGVVSGLTESGLTEAPLSTRRRPTIGFDTIHGSGSCSTGSDSRRRRRHERRRLDRVLTAAVDDRSHYSGTSRSGIGAPTKTRRQCLPSHCAHGLGRLVRALSVAMPLFA